MSYLDKYPNCMGCPVTKYCDTMIGSIKLCHSCDEPSIEEPNASAIKQIAASSKIIIEGFIMTYTLKEIREINLPSPLLYNS